MNNILNFLKKFWIPIAIIALYFLLAGLHFLPNGINIFKKKKLIIDDTPVMVKEIKELGELSTCEFYGEVYADINEVYEDVIINLKDSLAINPAAFYKNYSGLKEYFSRSNTYRMKEIEYNSEKRKYEALLNEHLKKLEEFKQNEQNLNQQIAAISDDRKEKKQLKNQLDDLSKNIEDSKSNFQNEQKKYVETGNNFNKIKEDFSQYKKDRNLVYIGRGWVKAGIDLKQLTEDNIIIDHGDSVSIQILVSDPLILDADINPWFIYTDEKKVKGFEIFVAKTGSIFTDKNFTDFEVTQLKLKCKEKLRKEAIEKGLLNNAKTSAVQTLENFFHIIGFEKVAVHFKSTSIVETTKL
jgi:hypothetical protein